MFEYFTQVIWSPYVAGAGIGVLSCLAFLLSDRPIGCSTAFVKARGLIGKAINPDKFAKKEYYREIIPQIDWAFMIIPGIIIGAFISAFISGQFHIIWVHAGRGDARAAMELMGRFSSRLPVSSRHVVSLSGGLQLPC